MSPGLKFLSSFVFLLAATALAHPGVGIVMDSRGNVFYTDLSQVWKIAPDGTKSIAVAGVHTHELGLDAADNLYGEHSWYEGDATKQWGHRVWRRSRDGRLTEVIRARRGFLSNYSFVRDGAGNMYWIDREKENSLMKRAPDGSITLVARKAAIHDPRWLTTTADGTVHLIDLFDIRRITPQGRVSTIARNVGKTTSLFRGLSDRHVLMGIWTDRRGNVYVASYGSREVKRIAPNGDVSVVATSRAPFAPTGGFIAPNGELWILETKSPIPSEVRVRRIDAGGRSRVY